MKSNNFGNRNTGTGLEASAGKSGTTGTGLEASAGKSGTGLEASAGKCLMPLVLLITMTNTATAQDLPLNLAPVTYQPMERKQIVDGVVEAVNQATIAAQTSGQVLEVNFDADDFVNKDDVLVRLKSVEQKSSMTQSQAQVNEAKAHLNVAQKEYNRVKQLYEKKVISSADLDKAAANLEVAEAHFATVEAGAVQAGEKVEYTEIKAPYSGIVLQRQIQPGEIAAAGHPIMTGFSLDALRVVATVPQSQVDAIRQSGKATILFGNGKEQRHFVGTKVTIMPYADTQTHTFKIRVELPAEVEHIYPGMFAKVMFVVGQDKRLVIPAKAVAYRGEVRAVYVVDKVGTVAMRQVRLGGTYGDKVEVVAGLEVNEQVATNPTDATIVLKKQRTQPSTDNNDKGKH
jgi:RND family efflux transporter MFP subunit